MVARHTGSVCLLAVMKRIENNVFVRDVVSEPVGAGADSPLPFAPFDSGQLLDAVLLTGVVWIFLENSLKPADRRNKGGVMFRSGSDVPLVAGSGKKAEGLGHVLRLLCS